MSHVITAVPGDFDRTVTTTLTAPSDGDALNVASVEDGGTTPKTFILPMLNGVDYLRAQFRTAATFDGSARFKGQSIFEQGLDAFMTPALGDDAGAWYVSVTVTTWHLIYEIASYVAGKPARRLYLGLNGKSMETTNAYWNKTTTKWVADDAALASEAIYLAPTTGMQVFHKAAAAAPWNDGAWDDGALAAGNISATGAIAAVGTISNLGAIVSGTTLTAGTGLTVTTGGAGITGDVAVTGALGTVGAHDITSGGGVVAQGGPLNASSGSVGYLALGTTKGSATAGAGQGVPLGQMYADQILMARAKVNSNATLAWGVNILSITSPATGVYYVNLDNGGTDVARMDATVTLWGTGLKGVATFAINTTTQIRVEIYDLAGTATDTPFAIHVAST